MANSTITNNDVGSVVKQEGEFKEETLTLAGNDTLLEGTILARDSVSLNLVIFVKGGATNENGIPKVVLINQFENLAGGAGDFPLRVMVSGVLRKQRLVIDADGDDSNIDAAVLDELRDYSLVGTEVEELSILDNQ